MADEELAQRFAKVVGFGEERPKCPVHRVTLSSVFGCTLCDGENGGGSTTATDEEQHAYFTVWEHQVLEEYELAQKIEDAPCERCGMTLGIRPSGERTCVRCDVD